MPIFGKTSGLRGVVMGFPHSILIRLGFLGVGMMLSVLFHYHHKQEACYAFLFVLTSLS